jgi:peptide chain release factor 1
MHTSTVTVAVIKNGEKSEFRLNESDVRKIYCRSRGNGGQKVNKTESCVMLMHMPTGIQVKVQDTKHRHQNEVIAWKRLKERLSGMHDSGIVTVENADRKNQVGSGQRGDKRRTYQIKHNTVSDHVTGRRTDMNSIWRGELQKLHPRR